MGPAVAASSAKLDAVRALGEVLVDLPRVLFPEDASFEPGPRLPRDGGGAENRTGPPRVVDVVRLEQEPRTAPKGRRHEILLREDRGHDAVRVLRPRDWRRVMFHDPVRGEAGSRRDLGEFCERLRRRIFRVQDDRAPEAFRAPHRIFEETITRGNRVGGDGEMRPSDFAECDRATLRDVSGGSVDPLLHRLDGRLGSDRLPKAEELDGIWTQGD